MFDVPNVITPVGASTTYALPRFTLPLLTKK